MAKPQLTIYFDLISPFTYIAFYVINNSKIFKQCDVKWVPAFLGGIMKHCNNTPPLAIKNKDKWIDLERTRWVKSFSVPMAPTMPPGFPVKTLSAQRAMAALSSMSEAQLPAAAHALYTQLFVKHESIANPEDFMPALEEILGKDLASKVQAEIGGKGKEILQKNTDEAISKGAFGMPWMIATNSEGQEEAFWGFDHLGQVVAHMGLDRGLGRNESGWASML